MCPLVFCTMLLFTTHSEEQMRARNISTEEVEDTVQNPQQQLPAVRGRQVFQSQYFDFVEQKNMLMRVIVEPQDEDLVVISVYKTSKVSKYWREELEA